ncbi:MAG: repair protein RecN [Chloroflexota bacterium]|jgi:DNA repair protein RecN (Recombination protein N)|nr:repair protein RecN [Chloroflexota bacterium]
MLRELAVRDLALIERARVELGAGLTVITGETGAGKSLLIDALGLVMGARADSGLVRHGATGARVEALFDRAGAADNDGATDDPLICVREVSAEGRSVARIDDETVTAARLAATVDPLVEIHGQHDQQRLLQGAWQRDVLDAYGGHGALRLEVSDAVRALRSNEAALRELTTDPAELQRRLELAAFAADEIEAAAPRAGEIDELRSRLALAGNAQRIAGLLTDAHDALSGEGRGAHDGLARASRAVADLARLDPSAEPLADRMNGLEAELDDVALELRRRSDSMVEAVGDTDEIEARLNILYGLLRKYGEDEAALAEYGAQQRAEVDRLHGTDAERARRQADGERLAAAAHIAATSLHEARARTATGLAGEVTARLVELGFPSAAFVISLDDATLDESGSDSVSYLLAPNPGEPPRPLAKIASGGELSRVALALKSVLATADQTPTLIFDEVDAGIGGRSADPVGRLLWRLARDHQVVCVTHLPQIAAYADGHLRIEKTERDGRTTTLITPLDAGERRVELAQMLGGVAGAEATLAAADELLARAREVREAVSNAA